MPKPGSEGHGKSGHLSDRLRQKAPRRYFSIFPLASRSGCVVRVVATILSWSDPVGSDQLIPFVYVFFPINKPALRFILQSQVQSQVEIVSQLHYAILHW